MMLDLTQGTNFIFTLHSQFISQSSFVDQTKIWYTWYLNSILYFHYLMPLSLISIPGSIFTNFTISTLPQNCYEKSNESSLCYEALIIVDLLMHTYIHNFPFAYSTSPLLSINMPTETHPHKITRKHKQPLHTVDINVWSISDYTDFVPFHQFTLEKSHNTHKQKHMQTQTHTYGLYSNQEAF